LYLRDSQYGDQLWERVMAAGKPYGITATAPSTIRSIEGGLLSYKSDITLADDPYVIGMDRFVDFEQPADFIGKDALKTIREQGPIRRLVGIEIHGDALVTPNGEYRDVLIGSDRIGHVTRCAHSPRLDKNIGWANVPVEFSEVGTELIVGSPDGEISATVCKAPWFPPQTKIPDAMKS
jgi:aminomethyltransferase